MRHGVRRGLALSIAVGLVVAGCGDSQSDDATDASVPIETGADRSDVDADVGVTAAPPAEPATMSTAALCDPIEGEVAAWAGGPMTPEHNTIYAESAEPILVCQWVVDGVDRSIRVDYVGIPDSFMLALVDGKQDRADVIAPNFHDKNAFHVIAANGWGIVVSNLGADRSEDPDPMAVIANAALARIGS